MTSAVISSLEYRGKTYTNLAIREVGSYRVPKPLLSRPVFASALDVVNISLDRTDDCYVIEPISDVVTTELLTEDVRLEIRPKVSFDALHHLLLWATHPGAVVKGRTLPIEFAPETGIYDLFAKNFVDSLEGLLRNGWMPEMRERALVSPEIRGRIDAARSLEQIYSKLAVSFHQGVGAMTFDAPANRVLRTAMLEVARSRGRVAPSIVDSAIACLASMPNGQPYSDPREALTACEVILDRRALDGSRSYYYPALRASMPILKALTWHKGGSIEQEDFPMRLSMPDIFESAVRNITATALSRSHIVKKASAEKLYTWSEPAVFNPTLEPDIVIRPLRDAQECAAVFDVKYKEKPSPSDHHQLAAYLGAYGAPIGAFITVADSPDEAGRRCRATARSGVVVEEYAIYAGDLQTSLEGYLTWLKQTVAKLSLTAAI